TVVGVGAGYGYDDAGPTHYATEDISCMRSVAGMEILTPADNVTVSHVAKESFTKPKLRYVRLDRKFLKPLYQSRPDFDYQAGLVETLKGKEVAIIASGFVLHTALKVAERLRSNGVEAGVVDVFRIKPLNVAQLVKVVTGYKHLVTLEEHFLSGGFGSA